MSEVANSNGSQANPSVPTETTQGGNSQSNGTLLDEKSVLSGFSDDDLEVEEQDLSGAVSPKKVDAAVKSGEITKEEGKALKKKLTLKVDGKEEIVEFDVNDEEALKKELQKSRAFDKRMKEFNEKVSQFDRFYAMLDQDPEGVLEKMGKDVNAMSEKRLEREIEKLKKSPDQIQKEKDQEELSALRKEKEEMQKKYEMEQIERSKNEHSQKITTDISEALDSAKSFLPKNAKTLMRIGQYMALAAQNGRYDITAKDVLPLVERDFKAENKGVYDQATVEQLIELWGEENLDRVRKQRIAAKRSQTMTAKQAAQDIGRSTSQEEIQAKKQSSKAKVSWNDMFGTRADLKKR